MKNWKYICGAEVGNSVTEKEFNSEADLRRWCIDHNYTYTPVGGGYYRLEDDKPGSHRSDLEAHVKAGNSKVGNALKYTNLEEAKKMCRQINDSLAPDAALRHYRNVYEKDGAYYVMETGEATAKGMKRVGNDTPAEYFSKKPKVIGNEKTGNEDLKSYSEVLEKAKRELEKVKEKEKMADSIKSKEEWASARREIEDKIKYYQSRIGNDKTGAEEFFKQLSDDVKEREDKDDADIEKVGNFKTGKSALKPGDRVQSYGVQGTVRKVEGENSDNIYGEPIIEVEWDNGTIKKVGEHYLRKIGNKVGNAGYPMLKSKVEELSKEGKSYEEVVKELLKFGFTRADIAQYEGYIREHIGNKKVGNSTYDMTERDYENEYKSLVQKRNNLQTGTKEYENIQKRLEEIRKKIGRSPFGNSASDDKFAYVMREFDEGKLKTPDGKVVTDPAQAKAIAYSESKKTENGCARARNAIKK